jgi:hypothetical protein
VNDHAKALRLVRAQNKRNKAGLAKLRRVSDFLFQKEAERRGYARTYGFAVVPANALAGHVNRLQQDAESVIDGVGMLDAVRSIRYVARELRTWLDNANLGQQDSEADE